MNDNSNTKQIIAIIGIIASCIGIFTFITGWQSIIETFNSIKPLGNLGKASTPSDAILGPLDGIVKRDGESVCLTLDDNLLDFVAEVIFVNPAKLEGVSGAGYGFRYSRYYQGLEVEYQTWIGWNDGFVIHASFYNPEPGNNVSNFHGLSVGNTFYYPEVKSEKGEINQLRLLINGNSAKLLVNGIPGTEWDLSEDGKFVAPEKSGKICVGLFGFAPDSVTGLSIPVTEAEFKGFTIWSLP